MIGSTMNPLITLANHPVTLSLNILIESYFLYTLSININILIVSELIECLQIPNISLPALNSLSTETSEAGIAR